MDFEPIFRLAMASRLHISAFAVSVVVLCGSAAPALAQSLADVARLEEARRKEIKQPVKVYTNKDLSEVPLPSTPAPDEAKQPLAAEAPSPDSSQKAKDAPGEKKDQAYWSGRMKGLSDQLSRDQTFADALQVQINALTADFASHDDPVQRNKIGSDRQKALTELERLKKAIQSDKKALSDLQEDARRAAVPPGWLR